MWQGTDVLRVAIEVGVNVVCVAMEVDVVVVARVSVEADVSVRTN